ncbi:Uncharacterized protein UPF0065 [Alkaliphilus metalliredigens QYMF]|uniref:Uncharacterized protein UPF0065 n=1 Tax=Alkaliphilus metalliredigens (strain QYMF) TaxID=293826 RepID=A6TSQ6_ALKMQ|nr:tripartite tricarboxylate transporter substrate binding protein [Alkaliphilus metalliredigens]ABR49224.1 Uncharacterized protein UPF0065 [Alkaliphilus metalliredigens QYMF]
MKKSLMIILSVLLILTVAGCAQDSGAPAGEYPTKPVDVIVAYAAGGGTDVGARLLTSVAEKDFAQPLVIQNIEGAGGEIGYTELAKADPDGYTIGFINLPTYVSLPMDRETQYAVDDLIPIGNHVYDPGVLVVQASSQWETLEDFIEDAKADPGSISVSNNGAGASNHIGAAHFEYEAGIELIHAPFDGTSNMLAALRGSHVDASVAKISEVADLVNGGELRILASFTEQRLDEFSEVPTLTEKGFEILFGSARALMAPKDTPDEIMETLQELFKNAIQSEEHLNKANEANLPIMYMGPEELQRYIENEAVYLQEVKPMIGF